MLQVELLGLFFGGAGLSCQAGLRRSALYLLVLSSVFLFFFLLPHAGGFGLPFIGRWLGFLVTGKLQVYPYDITTEASRLGLTHH